MSNKPRWQRRLERGAQMQVAYRQGVADARTALTDSIRNYYIRSAFGFGFAAGAALAVVVVGVFVALDWLMIRF